MAGVGRMDSATDHPPTRASSARLMGFDDWDRFESLSGGKGGASRAWKDGRAYVVKTYPVDDSPRGARERAALRALRGASGVPALLAEGDDPPHVVMPSSTAPAAWPTPCSAPTRLPPVRR